MSMNEREFYAFLRYVLNERHKNSGKIKNMTHVKAGFAQLDEKQKDLLNFFNYCFDQDEELILDFVNNPETKHKRTMELCSHLWHVASERAEAQAEAQAVAMSAQMVKTIFKSVGFTVKDMPDGFKEVMEMLDERDDLDDETKSEFLYEWLDKRVGGSIH